MGATAQALLVNNHCHAQLLNRIGITLTTVWRGIVPIPFFIRNYWNTNILDNYHFIQGSLAVVLILTAVFFLHDRPLALSFFLLAGGGLALCVRRRRGVRVGGGSRSSLFGRGMAAKAQTL